MVKYYLNKNQIAWLRDNLVGYKENIKTSVAKVYARDNGGNITRQIELYFMKDEENFMPVRCSVTPYGIDWDSPMAYKLVGIISDMLESNPHTLTDGAYEFTSLQKVIRENL